MCILITKEFTRYVVFVSNISQSSEVNPKLVQSRYYFPFWREKRLKPGFGEIKLVRWLTWDWFESTRTLLLWIVAHQNLVCMFLDSGTVGERVRADMPTNFRFCKRLEEGTEFTSYGTADDRTEFTSFGAADYKDYSRKSDWVELTSL